MPAAAFAADEYKDNYDAESYALTDVNATGLKTVLVVKVDSESDTKLADSDIVYIDQNDSGFNTATSFMLKAKPEPGLYRVYLGGDSNDPTYGYFSIAAEEVKTEDKAAAANNTIEKTAQNGKKIYDKGFTVEVEDGEEFNSIKLVQGETTVGVWSLEGTTKISGGAVNYGIEIYDIPEEYKDITVYMSADVVTNVKALADDSAEADTNAVETDTAEVNEEISEEE